MALIAILIEDKKDPQGKAGVAVTMAMHPQEPETIGRVVILTNAQRVAAEVMKSLQEQQERHP
jgi:hypothetical protein